MKILFLAANPQSTSRLNLGREVQEIDEGLRRAKLSDRFQLVQRWEVRPRDLRRALLEENPDIVHFSGHGKGQEGLVLVDNAGKPKPATGQALAGLFIQFPQIKCVLLNACYAEVQAKAIVGHIDYVIGMKDTILDDAAIAFTTGFYDGLGYGRTIEDAFELGRNAILWELSSFSNTTRQMIPVDLVKTESPESLPEHLKPILLKRAGNINQNMLIQPIPTVPSQTNDNPIPKYRERIKEYLAERILTPIAKFQLATLAKELGLSESEANQILQAELQKIDRAKENYQTLLKQTIEEGHYPFSSPIQQQLKELQTSLKLTDSEVAEISRPILQQAAEYQIQIRTKRFTFQVVTVDERGRENSRTTKEAELFTEDLGDGVTLEMVKIPGGTFLMGTEDEEIERLCQTYDEEWLRIESPQHKVNIPSFWMGRYPITQAQWRIVAGWESIERKLNPDPSYFKDNYKGRERWTRPVEQISWEEAVEFCARLSKKTNGKYRLPTEAEWEYACRAGTTTPFHFGETISTELANYRGTDWEYEGKIYPGNYGKGLKGIFREQTTPVGYFQVANAFGLYDMHGNVWEWCADHWHNSYDGAPRDGSAWGRGGNPEYRILRGGSWGGYPAYCRSAIRNGDAPANRYDHIGFRVVWAVLPGLL